MLIKVSDPLLQTILFCIVFAVLLLVTTRKRKDEVFFSKNVTNQLKGFAILAIVFSHIGYFIFADNRFLFPLSVLGGVGVNLFFFLSGFGLIVSQLKFPLSPLSFYKKRLFKLFIPLWIVIGIFFLMDFFWLGRTYPVSQIINSFLGFYPKGGSLFQNFNSPLWYFSAILFYYLIFPLTFIKKMPLLAPILVLLISLFVLNLPLPVDQDVFSKLYKIHFLAFPLGMLFGLIIQHFRFRINKFLKYFIILLAVLVLGYTAIHSGVGEDQKIEQGISLVTTLSLLIIFSLSNLDFKLFSLFGIYSYEVYLIHWPILSRYNLFLGLPAFLITILNLWLILILGYLLQKGIEKIRT